ncbi:MAG: hypothetical protein H8E39_05955 [Alphaproteobacteria bacterium]|nr:hypothetical protein [Alphaproteobacteria bacterium]
MGSSSMQGEIMRNAQRLVKSKGDNALEYACKMSDRMQELGDENYYVFWEKISKQVELLIYANEE